MVLPMTSAAITPHRFAAAMAFTACARIWERWTIWRSFRRPIRFSWDFFPGRTAWPTCLPRSAAFPNGIPALGANPTQTYVPTAAILQGFNTATARFPECSQACSPVFSGNVNGLIQLAVPLHWVAGTTQQWNFTIQRELGRDWFMELGYVGTKGTRLRSTYDPDQATLATPQNPVTFPGQGCANLQAQGLSCTIVDSTVENASARAPYIGIAPGDFEDFAPNSDSHYSALQATLAHRFGKGLYFQSAYTWSKSIDDVSTASVAFLTRVNDQNRRGCLSRPV